MVRPRSGGVASWGICSLVLRVSFKETLVWEMGSLERTFERRDWWETVFWVELRRELPLLLRLSYFFSPGVYFPDFRMLELVFSAIDCLFCMFP